MTQRRLVCGEAHGAVVAGLAYLGQALVASETMKTLDTHPDLVTAWLLAQGGMAVQPARAVPTAALSPLLVPAPLPR